MKEKYRVRNDYITIRQDDKVGPYIDSEDFNFIMGGIGKSTVVSSINMKPVRKQLDDEFKQNIKHYLPRVGDGIKKMVVPCMHLKRLLRAIIKAGEDLNEKQLQNANCYELRVRSDFSREAYAQLERQGFFDHF